MFEAVVGPTNSSRNRALALIEGAIGASDESSLDGFAMMAPLADLSSKADNTIAMKSSEPIATGPSILLSAEGISVKIDVSFAQSESKPSTDASTEKAKVKSESTGSLKVMLTDDFFSDFDDREIS